MGQEPARARGPTPWSGTSECPTLLCTTCGYSFWEGWGRQWLRQLCQNPKPVVSERRNSSLLPQSPCCILLFSSSEANIVISPQVFLVQESFIEKWLFDANGNYAPSMIYINKACAVPSYTQTQMGNGIFFWFFHTASDEVLRAHNLTSHSPLALQMKNSPLCQLLRCLFLHLLFVLGLTLLITVPPKPYCSALQEECCYIDCLCVSPALSGAALG